MKIEATTAALVTQSATAAATAAAITEQWWFAVITAAIGTLFAIHAEGSYEPHQVRKVVMRLLMLTAFSWVLGVYVAGIEHIPLLNGSDGKPMVNPALVLPEWVRTGIIGLFSPYIHALMVAFLKRKTGATAEPAT